MEHMHILLVVMVQVKLSIQQYNSLYEFALTSIIWTVWTNKNVQCWISSYNIVIMHQLLVMSINIYIYSFLICVNSCQYSVVESSIITVNLTARHAPTVLHSILYSHHSRKTRVNQLLLSSGSNYIILTDFIITLTSVHHNQSGTIHLLLVMILDQLLLV